jgi:hypothetical protein
VCIYVCINLYSEERNRSMSKFSSKCSAFLLRRILLANYSNNSEILHVTFEPKLLEINTHSLYQKITAH